MAHEPDHRCTDGDMDDTTGVRCAMYAVIGTTIAAGGYYLAGRDVTHLFVTVVLTSLFALLLASASWRERRKDDAKP